jgi:hypothetical protein
LDARISLMNIGKAKQTMKAELLCTIEKFPSLREKITTLFNENDEFQVLCHDYFLCVKSLGQLEISFDKDETFLHEYKDLKVTLEKELLRFLGHWGQINNGGGGLS